MERAHRPPRRDARGRSFDEVFDESYSVSPIRRATEVQRRMWLLATEPVRAGKDGSIALDAGRVVGERLSNRYWSAAAHRVRGLMLAARFDPQRLHDGVHVYTSDGRYICFAPCDRPAGFNDQLAGRERNRARNAFGKAAKVMLEQERRMDILDVQKARAGDQPTIPAPQAVPERSVIRAEFGREVPKAIELPEAQILSLSRELARPQQKVPSDPSARYAWFVRLTEAAANGVAIPEELQGFLETYPSSAERRSAEKFFDEFSLSIEEYSRDLVLDDREARAA
jgi:putative transposase